MGKGWLRWLLFLALALAVVLVIVGFSLRWKGLEDASAGNFPAGQFAGPTSRHAYTVAAATALSWQPDAQLASAMTHWRYLEGRWSGLEIWTLQFYSPAAQRLATIVFRDGQGRLVRDELSPYPMTTFDVEDWQIDGLQALEVWWREGGESFLAHYPEVDLTARLRQDEGRPVWTVTGLTDHQAWLVVVDGCSGEPLSDE